jgi:hypothetical protein
MLHLAVLLYQILVINYLFLKFHIVTDNREYVFIFDYYTKEKIFGKLIYTGGGGGLCPSYKSESLVFRCFFYYILHLLLIFYIGNAMKQKKTDLLEA